MVERWWMTEMFPSVLHPGELCVCPGTLWVAIGMMLDSDWLKISLFASLVRWGEPAQSSSIRCWKSPSGGSSEVRGAFFVEMMKVADKIWFLDDGGCG